MKKFLDLVNHIKPKTHVIIELIILLVFRWSRVLRSAHTGFGLKNLGKKLKEEVIETFDVEH